MDAMMQGNEKTTSRTPTYEKWLPQSKPETTATQIYRQESDKNAGG